MSRIWNFLLDLDRLPADAETIRFGWERPLPGWAWALAILVLAALTIWSYRGLVGHRGGRGVLAATRFVMLLLLIVLIAGPALVVPRELIERDWVVYLVDRSASMRIADVPDAPGRRIERDEQLRNALSESAVVFIEISTERNALWLGFDEGAYDLPLREVDRDPLDRSERDGRTAVSPGQARGYVPDLATADGRRTAIGPTLEQALRRVAARPVSGIVLFSDGQTPQPPNRALLRRLQADAIPIISVPLGSDEPVGDLAVGRVEAPSRAFVHDQVPVEVWIERWGGWASSPSSPRGTSPEHGLEAHAPAGAEVILLDGSGRELDRRRIEAGEPVDSVTLIAEPQSPGPTEWLVRIEPEGFDLIPENNERPLPIELVDRPLKVLYIEGYPRWEYRYLKELLVREETIDSSIMLLSADRDFAQEGDSPITRLPNSPEEWEPYDVIVIGDVHAEFFSVPQQEMIRAQMSERGAGLLLIAGPRSNPQTFTGNILASALPLRGSLAVSSVGRPVTMRPTETARRLSVLQILRGEEDAWPILSDPNQGWPSFQWALRIDATALKPAVEVLAQSVESVGGRPIPLVTHMRFGSGQTAFVATDEIWRWRWGQGELLPEQFWIQMLRMLGRDRLSMSGQPAVLTLNPRRAEVGQPAVIELRLLDANLAERAVTEIPIELVDVEDGGVIAALSLTPVGDAPGRFSTTWLPDRAGEIEVRILDPALARFALAGRMEVIRPDDEMRRPQADHALLAQIAEETGGRVLRPDELDDLPQLLPNRSVRTPMDLVESLWDTPLFFGLVLLLLTMEWIGRKMLRLN